MLTKKRDIKQLSAMYPARFLKAFEMWQSGKSEREVAAHFNITPGRAAQLVRRGAFEYLLAKHKD